MKTRLVLAAVLLSSVVASAQYGVYAAYPIYPATAGGFSVVPGSVGATDDLAYLETQTGLAQVISFPPGATAPQLTTATPPITNALVLGGDMNGDALVDLVFVNFNAVAILQRTATGYAPLGAAVALTSIGGATAHSRLIDWEGDGDLDLLHQNEVSLNDGLGGLSAPSPFFPTSFPDPWIVVRDIDAADVDFDGDADVLVALPNSVVLYVNAGGTLVPGRSWPVAANGLIAVRIVDFDHDGGPDLWSMSGPASQVVTHGARSFGGGLFQNPVVSPLPMLLAPFLNVASVDLEVVDYEGDGRKELAALFLHILGTSGHGYLYTFGLSGALVVLPALGGQPFVNNGHQLLAGRFNADGGTDLAVRTFGSFGAGTEGLEIFATAGAAPTHDLTIVSGAGQIATSVDPTPLPVVVRLTDPTKGGAPVVGQTITATPSGALLLQPIGGWTTDAAGEVRFTITGGQYTGTQHVHLDASGLAATVVDVTVGAAGVLTAVSAPALAVNFGEPTSAPIVVRALRPNGLPLVGVELSLLLSSGISLPAGAPPLVTNATGEASFVVVPGTLTGSSTVSVFLGLGPNASTVTFDIGIRRFRVIRAATILSLNYGHEDGPLPLLIAADVPGPITQTPFGDIATSVLAPLSSLIVLDGLGVFGPPDPTIVATPTFSRVYTGFPPTLLGVNLVFQLYAIDFDYSFPENIVVAPAVTVTL